MQSPNWQVIERPNTAGPASRMIVRLPRPGRAALISLSRAAHEAIGRPRRVVVRIDDAAGVIGIAPATEDDAGSFSASPSSGGSVSISANSILRRLGWDRDGYSFTPTVEDGMLIVSLDDAP